MDSENLHMEGLNAPHQDESLRLAGFVSETNPRDMVPPSDHLPSDLLFIQTLVKTMKRVGVEKEHKIESLQTEIQEGK